MVVAFTRAIAGASRTGGRMSIAPRPMAVSTPRTLRTSAVAYKPSPTKSEDAVHADKSDAGPKELQDKTANKAQAQHNAKKSASPNDEPTHSEDSVHADKHSHDPLPEGKKKRNSSH